MSTAIASRRAECTLLETGLPYRELAQLTRRDRLLTDPVYGAHKWWARRPRSVIRALVLAAHLPGDTDPATFWRLYNSNEPVLDGAHVGDPFSGGGTTLVESARLGAAVTGIDIDPLAVRIIESELGVAPSSLTEEAGRALLEEVRRAADPLYPVSGTGEMPLHYFWLRRGGCSHCGEVAHLYRGLVLARDAGKAGAVRRDHAQTAFCPDCLQLHHLPADRTILHCCGHDHTLSAGNFTRAGFRCAACGERSSLAELQPAGFEDVLLAVETTAASGYRVLRAPTAQDRRAIAQVSRGLEDVAGYLPTASLEGVDGGRPASYGYRSVRELFTDRQLVVLGQAFARLAAAEVPVALRAQLELALSETLAANNRLCGYAVDYGRLSPAFTGVRSYSLPIIFCELNMLHPTAGRGTLASALRHVARAGQPTYRRAIWRRKRVEHKQFDARRPVPATVVCQTAERALPAAPGALTAIITDPPYFDYIAYSDLSLLRRAWLAGERELPGVPIFPCGDDGARDFARRLGRALRASAAALAPDAVLALTYHSSQAGAWFGLAEAVKAASLRVSAVFPVWADARSGAAHGHEGSCEWDLVWVCRARHEAVELPTTTDDWLSALADFQLRPADINSITLGLAAARWVNEPQ